VGNEDNLMAWSEGENSITQATNTRGLLADLLQQPANVLRYYSTLGEAWQEVLPENILENASCGKGTKKS
jgi:hypothetical protein